MNIFDFSYSGAIFPPERCYSGPMLPPLSNYSGASLPPLVFWLADIPAYFDPSFGYRSAGKRFRSVFVFEAIFVPLNQGTWLQKQ
jgi:hypothetical protein